MTDDLVAFLRARLDDDKQTALSVSTGPHQPEQWTAVQYRDGVRGWRVDGQHSVVVDGAFEKDARHIARHDPARILADVAAKHAIVDEHQDVNDGSCDTCVDGQWGYPTHGVSTPQHWPCRTLRLLALPYADHPDYRPEWAPGA